ncbi:MAG: hypothetical protein KAU14_04245, partial [Thermoplasmata archaeon]|nr:hypothetical protein [Thermoplasmata archaeon]
MRKRIFYAAPSMLILALLFFLSQGTVSANPEPEYHPYAEVISDMKSVAANNPDIVTLHNLSMEYSAPLTHQNRSLLALR